MGSLSAHLALPLEKFRWLLAWVVAHTVRRPCARKFMWACVKSAGQETCGLKFGKVDVFLLRSCYKYMLCNSTLCACIVRVCLHVALGDFLLISQRRVLHLLQSVLRG